MSNTIETIMTRRSCRSYKEDQIPEEILTRILECGLQAPNSGGKQAWYFSVVQNKDTLAKMGGIIRDKMQNSGVDFLVNMASMPGYDPLHHAPTVVFVSAPESNQYGSIDGALAAGNMVLSAAELGIASCITTSSQFAFGSPEGQAIKSELGIPAENRTVCAVALGYQDKDPMPAAPRSKTVISFVK